MAFSLDEALGMSLADEADESIHVGIDTRQVTIPESQQVFGVESDEDVEVKHIVIDGRYADGTDLSTFTFRVNYQNANGDKGTYLATELKVNDDSIEFDWVIGRQVVAYKGTIAFIVCAYTIDSSSVIQNEWNSTLGKGIVLEGLEVSEFDFGDDIVRQLASILSDVNAAQASAKASADEAYKSKTEVVALGKEQQAAIEKKGKDALASIPEDYTQVSNDVSQLKEDTRNLWKSVADTRAYIGLSDDDILGLQVDYKNKTFKRLAGATNLTAGADFDAFPMYGGRKRCNVADDGTINAWFGDDGYTEDGSNGQVMVYQPKFYYLVCPVVYDPITTTGIGYHLRKANYYVSAKPRPGFRLHPAFYDANGNEVEYVMESAFEGSIFDASASAYLLDNEQVMDANADKFCSIAGARPATGHSQNLTRDMVEKLAANRGTGWHGDTIKVESASQLLMIIELGLMNAQNAIGQGVVNLPWTTGSDTTTPYAARTGSTSALGNGTGRATSTTTYPGNVETTDTANGKTSVSWRGKENPWGNLWKFVGGMNIYGNGKMDGGQPYICNDFNFNESKHDGNYEAAGFTVTPKEGYISAMGYSTACDWLFVASETNGNSNLPVGDYTYVTQNLNGSRLTLLGGTWTDGTVAGPFYWSLSYGVGYRARYVGGRLVYVPDAENQQTVTA